MWIALNDGFISVVQADMKRLPKRERKHRRTNDFLCVRARSAEHLKALFPDRHIYQWPGRDYPARIFIDKADFAEFIAKRSERIDYGNFKSSVKDDELHDAYMQVWSAMRRYQYGHFTRKPWSPYQQREFGWYPNGIRVDGDPANEFLDETARRTFKRAGDEEVCGLLGCTAENPCMDCLIDATQRMNHEDEERYGDFDERDDADAKSHLRVPPK